MTHCRCCSEALRRLFSELRHKLWSIRAVAAVRRWSGFSLMSYKADCQWKISGGAVFMFFNPGLRNAYTSLFMYLFQIDQNDLALTRTSFLRPEIWRAVLWRILNWSTCFFFFSQESGYYLMPYDLHPFLIFASCQYRLKGSSIRQTNLTHVNMLKHPGCIFLKLRVHLKVAWRHGGAVHVSGGSCPRIRYKPGADAHLWDLTCRLWTLMDVPTSFNLSGHLDIKTPRQRCCQEECLISTEHGPNPTIITSHANDSSSKRPNQHFPNDEKVQTVVGLNDYVN